jgi:hypothetical protein
MKATAVPWPDTTRKIMPSATVHSQITIPAGRIASGRRQARDAPHPAASPHRNGQAVDAIPPSASPLVWLARPITTKMSTQQTSMSSATRALLANRMRPTLPGHGSTAARCVPGA